MDLKEFIESKQELNSLKVYDHLDRMNLHDNIVDMYSDLQDVEAMVAIGHTTNGLDGFLENYGTIDLSMTLHEARCCYIESLNVRGDISTDIIDDVFISNHKTTH